MVRSIHSGGAQTCQVPAFHLRLELLEELPLRCSSSGCHRSSLHGFAEVIYSSFKNMPGVTIPTM